MSGIIIEEAKQTPVEEQRMEFLERKGTGHPDSICDAIMEDISIALCRAFTVLGTSADVETGSTESPAGAGGGCGKIYTLHPAAGEDVNSIVNSHKAIHNC